MKDKDDGTLVQELQANVEKPVALTVYSSKTTSTRGNLKK